MDGVIEDVPDQLFMFGLTQPDEPWSKVEARFRVWSFSVYYRKLFAGELDPVVRFAKALRASCQPIRDRSLVYAWYQARKQRFAACRKQHADAAPVSA
ncbi:MAG TPA: hypothetical protein P5572_13205 [Phycisphaerae bacterium]|nr:hypothetical protein [Phycisphaerae bacterium]